MRRDRAECWDFFLNIVRRMQCWLRCFSAGDDDDNDSRTSMDSVPFLWENQLLTLHLLRGAELEDGDACGSQFANNDVDRYDNHAQLKYEAEFLKSCGTLLEIPDEIQKASKKMGVLTHHGHNVASKFITWFPVTYGKKINWQDQSFQVPISPEKAHEEPGMSLMHENSDTQDLKTNSLHGFESPNSGGLKQNERDCFGFPKSIAFESPKTASEVPVCSSSNDTSPTATLDPSKEPIQGKKAVQFKCIAAVHPDKDSLLPSSTKSRSKICSCKRSDSGGSYNVKGLLHGSQQSPCPTPLKLSDEMQTPGTVYPAKLATVTIEKTSQI